MMSVSFIRLTAVATIVLASAAVSAAAAESAMKQCGEQWQAAKAAGATNGETWPQFLKDCRARLASTTASQGSSTPAAPKPAPPPAPANYGEPAPASTEAGEFASEQQARARCPSDTIVWVNNISHVYHFNVVSSHGRSFYGHTKDGGYMCETDARAAGDRAAKDERHP